MKRKIITIVGARPQFVKAAVVSRAIARLQDLEEIIVHTGQHFDKNMSDVFFEEMQIPKPKYNLAIHGVNHGAMTGRMLEGIEEVLVKEQPDLLLVYGDTNSTLAGALAAKKLHIPVAHIEAGLRSYNDKMPEEVNRILTDRISDLLFCPTQTAIDNLYKEGYKNIHAQICHSGDVMLDAAMFYAKQLTDDQKNNETFVLTTIHRAENTDDKERLSFIIDRLNTLHQKIPVVLPLHPRTAKKIKDFGLKLDVNTIDPVGYLEMIALLKNAQFVITDSGGLQKEAFFFSKHCITLREQTEWVELIEAKANVLVNSKDAFDEAVQEIMNGKVFPNVSLYGDGNSGEAIVKTISEFLNRS